MTANKWISIKDGLPEKSVDMLLIRTANGHIYVANYNPSGQTFKARYRNVKYHRVTHYLIIPEPPTTPAHVKGQACSCYQCEMTKWEPSLN